MHLRPRPLAVPALLALAVSWASAASPEAPASAVLAADDPGLAGARAALGWEGPLGPWGPLGELGPIGRNVWNPSRVMAGLGPWSSLADRLTSLGGPLSEDGPLGPRGPLAPASLESLATHPVLRTMAPGGPLSVLGPTGPLGALGPLGPLGPMGGHGFAPDAAGNYRAADGTAVHQVRVAGRRRPMELVESYREGSQPDLLDTSFLLQGEVSPGADDVFRLRSACRQQVTLVALPLRSYRPFLGGLPDPPLTDGLRVLFDVDLSVTRTGDHPTVASDSTAAVDWIRFRAEPGETFEVRVSAKERGRGRPYRLVAVGSAGIESRVRR